ncbi:CsbD family protein [Neptunicella sp. SCSIO 80796]|uniref:CsbD family protein n=1 Tax=Neptunicella plasticusilytica TaxID=3117012 RepID=UPI003A4D4C75
MTNKNIWQGKWKQLKGNVKQQWGKLTDDDLDKIEGREEEIVGLIQERYGIAEEQAKAEYHDWMSKQ